MEDMYMSQRELREQREQGCTRAFMVVLVLMLVSSVAIIFYCASGNGYRSGYADGYRDGELNGIKKSKDRVSK